MADVTVVEQNVIKVVRVDDNQFNIITLATQGPAGADGNDGVDFGKNNALVGSDGVTVTSGSNTDTISGFQTEFVSASGSLQTQIDSLSAAGVSSVNAVTGAVLVTGTQNVTTQTVGQTITITGPDLSTYATSAEVDSDVAAVSGTLSAEIDSDISTHAANASAHHTRYTSAENDAITGSDGITITSGSSSIDVAGFRTEFVNASGTLQTAIDAINVDEIEPAIVGSDGITVTSGASTTTVAGFYTEFTNASGTLNDTIDTDIATHAADSSAHHTRYSSAENPAIVGAGANTVVSGSDIITVSGLGPVHSDPTFIPFPGSGIDGTGDGSEDVDWTLGFDMTIDEAVVATTAGSLTYSVLIDDVIVEGLDNQSVTTSEATDTATSANEYFKGSVITVAISGASNAQGFRFTLNSTRNS